MRKFAKRVLGVMACTTIVGLSANAWGLDKAPARADDAPAATENDRILTAKTFRTSKLVGMNVRNMNGEVLGTIDDLVIDVRNGKVQYAALSVGGLLGLGDKLLAVPFGELKFDHGQDEQYFVLDMPLEKIAAAPGFDKSSWPNFADKNWTDKIDQHYRKTAAREHEATEQRTGERDDEN